MIGRPERHGYTGETEKQAQERMNRETQEQIDALKKLFESFGGDNKC